MGTSWLEKLFRANLKTFILFLDSWTFKQRPVLSIYFRRDINSMAILMKIQHTSLGFWWCVNNLNNKGFQMMLSDWDYFQIFYVIERLNCWTHNQLTILPPGITWLKKIAPNFPIDEDSKVETWHIHISLKRYQIHESWNGFKNMLRKFLHHGKELQVQDSMQVYFRLTKAWWTHHQKAPYPQRKLMKPSSYFKKWLLP